MAAAVLAAGESVANEMVFTGVGLQAWEKEKEVLEEEKEEEE